MSIIASSNFFTARKSRSQYQIERDLRFNSADSAYLNRTPSSAGNRKTWTWSGWVKRTGFGQNFLFSTGADSSNRLQISFENITNDNLHLEAKSGGSTQALLTTTASYRDSSGWYHIVVALDTPQATAANRLKFYINGEQVSTFQNSTYPSQNAELEINKAIEHNIGKRTYSEIISTVTSPRSTSSTVMHTILHTLARPTPSPASGSPSGMQAPTAPTDSTYRSQRMPL